MGFDLPRSATPFRIVYDLSFHSAPLPDGFRWMGRWYHPEGHLPTHFGEWKGSFWRGHKPALWRAARLKYYQGICTRFLEVSNCKGFEHFLIGSTPLGTTKKQKPQISTHLGFSFKFQGFSAFPSCLKFCYPIHSFAYFLGKIFPKHSQEYYQGFTSRCSTYQSNYRIW